MNWYIVALALLVVWLGHWAWCLGSNYLAARSWGVPILVGPLDPDAVPFIIIKVPLRPIFKALLPKSIYESFKVSIFGWEFLDKGLLHARIGPTFVYVTPTVNEVWTSDPVMAHEMLSRRKDFGQLRMTTVIMSVLGHNIFSADGDDWARQRRLVAPNLNERIMETVWNESSAQARQMSAHLLENSADITKDIDTSLRTVAINVIGQAGYGQSRPWSSQPMALSAKEKLSYSDSIYLVMLNLVPAVFLSPRFLQLPFMSESLRLLGKAKRDLPSDTRAMLEEERARVGQGQNFMTMLVKFVDQSAETKGSQFMSNEEIQGNLFAFTGAGFETTSNTMFYAITLLAAYPQWQAWMQEELDREMPDASQALDYASAYPRFLRCLAVMHEVLRLFPPVIHVGKESTQSQTLNGKDGPHHISLPVKVYINIVGLHHDTSVWGKDAAEFRPSRWLREDEGRETEFIAPSRGTFLPWSSGPRVCPGQKMSTVEFTATMGTIFRFCKIEPAPRDSMSKKELQQRLLDLTQDSQSRTTLQMNRPQEVVLKCSSRV